MPVVARIRPLLGEAELEKDRIVHADPSVDGKPTIVRIPSPKSASEEFKFTFNAVYDVCSQEEIFTNEGQPYVHLSVARHELIILQSRLTSNHSLAA